MKQITSLMFGGLLVAGTLLPIAVTDTALAAGMYDGTYHGTLAGDGSNAMACAKQAPTQITVTDNKLEYVHMGHATITATVAADGSFSGSGANSYTGGRSGPQVQTLDGKIAGGAIEAQTKVGNSCTYKLHLKKF